jgi:hypothetical protein
MDKAIAIALDGGRDARNLGRVDAETYNVHAYHRT